MDEEVKPVYFSETGKIRSRIAHYLGGDIVDIGAGPEKITPESYGVDGRNLPGIDLVTRDLSGLSKILKKKYDVVFSSHCLEHFRDDVGALADWIQCAKIGGLVILYLPDGDHYNNAANPEHLHEYTYEKFCKWVYDNFSNAVMIDSGLDIGYDRYSFYVVLKRII